MSTTTISHTVSTGRPALDTIVERLAIGMLRWSEHRAELAASRPVRVYIDYGRADQRDFASSCDRAIEVRRMRFF